MNTVKQLIESWVNVSPDFNPSLVVFKGNAADSATVGANFLGNDTSDPGATGKIIYSDPKNLPTAIASIMNHAQNRANFHPASALPAEVAQSYYSYINEIDRTPFLHLTKNDRTVESYKSNNYNALIDKVVSLYDGVSQADRESLKKTIAEMGNAVMTETDEKIEKNLFSQSTIEYSTTGELKLFIYYTTLHMQKTDKKFNVSINQDYTVNRCEYKILTEMIKVHANTLANLEKKNIDDWTGESSTPERQDAKLCFEVLPHGK